MFWRHPAYCQKNPRAVIQCKLIRTNTSQYYTTPNNLVSCVATFVISHTRDRLIGLVLYLHELKNSSTSRGIISLIGHLLDFGRADGQYFGITYIQIFITVGSETNACIYQSKIL